MKAGELELARQVWEVWQDYDPDGAADLVEQLEELSDA
jgi:hypothetical protein